jgi:hypothetical protein
LFFYYKNGNGGKSKLRLRYREFDETAASRGSTLLFCALIECAKPAGILFFVELTFCSNPYFLTKA